MQTAEVLSIPTAEKQGLKLTAVSVALTPQVLKQARSPTCPDDYHVMAYCLPVGSLSGCTWQCLTCSVCPQLRVPTCS